MDPTAELAMFPLGSVLFPSMPLPLRVFEERYLTMLQDILPQEPAEFGVVLIERGHEVGGGEQRFAVGTVARVAEVSQGEGFIGLLAQGGRRIEVIDWLGESPYPRAVVRAIADLEWDEQWSERLAQTEVLVRRTLARASEYDDQRWPATVELDDDPVAGLWQLAAIAPLGEWDQVRLLRVQTVPELLDALVSATTEAAELLDARSS